MENNNDNPRDEGLTRLMIRPHRSEALNRWQAESRALRHPIPEPGSVMQRFRTGRRFAPLVCDLHLDQYRDTVEAAAEAAFRYAHRGEHVEIPTYLPNDNSDIRQAISRIQRMPDSGERLVVDSLDALSGANMLGEPPQHVNCRSTVNGFDPEVARRAIAHLGSLDDDFEVEADVPEIEIGDVYLGESKGEPIGEFRDPVIAETTTDQHYANKYYLSPIYCITHEVWFDNNAGSNCPICTNGAIG